MPLVYETIEALVRVELAAMSPDEMAVGNVSACFFMSVCFWRCADPLPHNVPAMQAAPTIVHVDILVWLLGGGGGMLGVARHFF